MNKKLSNRELMELAVDIMSKSIPESRKDGKISPKVGVVIVKPDGSVETAYRGEIRYGDHAEFTLLERKNRSNKLDGSRLFSTLEPCSEDSRNPPKIECAERIHLARIREVWVGIQDPDPTVARKGIKQLEDKGIKVYMFDRDLQEVIEKENKDFLKQANERAVKDKEKKDNVLSPLENKFATAKLADFSEEALKMYHDRADIADAIGSSEFHRRLLQQGILKEDGKQFFPTGFGILLFGKEPRQAMRQAGLLASIQYAGGNQERKEFDEPAALIPGILEKWLRDKLPNIFSRNQMQREEKPALPFEMIREAVINALIHRDYSIEGAKCQIVVTEDIITIKSPGKPPSPITLEQMQNFTAPMLSRNPGMHFIFARMGMAEEQGFGLGALRDQSQQLHLPLPRYIWNAPYLVLKIYLSKQAAVKTLAQDIVPELSKSEKLGWEWISMSQGPISAKEYAIALKIPKRTALNHFKHFVELKLIKLIGSGPTTRYEAVK